MCRFNCLDTCAYKYEGGLVEKSCDDFCCITVLFTSTCNSLSGTQNKDFLTPNE